jgi:hypothetical protein
LEGSLHASARREGRYLHTTTRRSTSNKTTCTFTCTLGHQHCDFLVRLSGMDSVNHEVQLRCMEVRSAHTCISSASPPDDGLSHLMDFFVCTSALHFSTDVDLFLTAEGPNTR